MNSIVAAQMMGGNPSKERSRADFYPTPPDVTEALLHFLGLPKTTTIWEPACGEMDMVSEIRSAGYSVVATDLSYGQDFLTEPLRECDWIITNPPFSISDKFIKRCVEHGKPFALLLKSQYWHAYRRYDLFKSALPTFVCPLTWRPNFKFKERVRGNSLMDVMWCIWLPPYKSETRYCPLNKPEVVSDKPRN